jgi:hypothetical protein
MNFGSIAGFDLQRWIAERTHGNNPHTKEQIDPVKAECCITV